MNVGFPARLDAPPPALELKGISKTFGTVRALEEVTFSAAAGTVHALLGENGAGKSTLMRIAYGLLQADAGQVRLFGRAMEDHGVANAVKAGVGMVHQQLSLVPTLTAVENVALGRRGFFRPREAGLELTRLATATGLRVDPDALVGDLSLVERQRLEILKALARGARLLILDEPTSGLAPGEVDDLLRWIRQFADHGGTVVLVTHRLREAVAVADDVTVLRRGRVARVARAAGATVDELAGAIFPDAPQPARTSATAPVGSLVASLDKVSIIDARGVARLRSVSLGIRRGEIVGVAAVEGSGHRELLAVAAGLVSPTTGTARTPPNVALIPADRARDAIIPEFTLVENIALRGAGSRRGRMPWQELAARTAALVERFSIVAPSPHARAQTLSGGNQQRLVIARELADEVDLVIADDPARGLDFRATQFVHEQLREATARGAGIMIHSTDLDELLAVATRIIVVFHGEVREVPGGRDEVGRAMLGG